MMDIGIRATAFVILLSLNMSRAQFTLTIVHTNDVHARFEEANADGGICKEDAKAQGECFGGVARRLTKIRELNETNPNMILLDAGDQYQGTLWFYVYKGNAAAHFMNKLGYQAMALGNHEFDNGIAGLFPILNETNFPVLSANIDASQEPSVDGKFVPSTILEVGGQKIGIVGYTTPETPSISNTSKLVFIDEVIAMQPVINQMKADGINKIIALGHSGYARDREMAKLLHDVDVIIGGHSHTFLYTGTPPSDDPVIGPYPTIEKNADGDTILIVQDFFFGKYLGFLKVEFTMDGKVDKWEGLPILMNGSVAQDPDLLADVKTWKEAVINASHATVGCSLVYLDGRRTVCRLEECNLGNLVADSMVYEMSRLEAPNGAWTLAAIGIMNSGGVRAPIDKGEITMEDVLTLLPFQNYLDVIYITGKNLLQVLEHAVAKYDRSSPRGEFLQVSGIQIVYDVRLPSGHRVVRALVRCHDCSIPSYSPIDPTKLYPIVLPVFTANGGDGFNFDIKKRLNMDILDSDSFRSFISRRSPVFSSVEGRIRFCSTDNTIDCPVNRLSSCRQLIPQSFLTLLAVFFSLLSRMTP